MSTKLPRELKHDAIILSDKGYTQTAISDILKISVSSIQRAKYKLRDHGDIEGGSKKRGRKAKLSPDLEDTLLWLVLAVPTGYLSEYSTIFHECFGVKLSESRISQILKMRGISHKRLHKEAKQRNQQLRDYWDSKLAHWQANQLVFIDESGLNSKLGERNNGWGKRGKRVRAKVSGQKSSNFSLLPALTIDGYIACNLYDGAVNGERFEEFIEDDVLPHCTPFPGPRSIIVMDNASIHRGDDIRAMIEDHGCKLEFLPPYSPDYNPIEFSFSVIKSALKSSAYQLFGDEKFEEMAAKVKAAVDAKITPGVARSQFQHCRIRV